MQFNSFRSYNSFLYTLIFQPKEFYISTWYIAYHIITFLIHDVKRHSFGIKLYRYTCKVMGFKDSLQVVCVVFCVFLFLLIYKCIYFIGVSHTSSFVVVGFLIFCINSPFVLKAIITTVGFVNYWHFLYRFNLQFI